MLASLLAPDTDNNVTYQALPLLLFLLVIAACLSWLFKTPVFRDPAVATVRDRRLAAPLPGGGEEPLHASPEQPHLLENLAGFRPSFEAWLAVHRAEQKLLRSFRFSALRPRNPFKVAVMKDAEVPPIPPGQEVEVQVEFKPLRRGVLRFTGVTLARTDPLGFVSSAEHGAVAADGADPAKALSPAGGRAARPREYRKGRWPSRQA